MILSQKSHPNCLVLPPSIAEQIIHLSMVLLRSKEPTEKNHFSFITDKNRIVAVGQNHMFKTSPLAKRYGYRYSAYHSELSAWQNAPRELDWSRCRLFNVRLSSLSLRFNRPILRNSKPCPICEGWLLPLSLREIWYTTDEGWNKL